MRADLVRRLGAPPSGWWALAWLLPLAAQIAHTVAVAPTYHVGSFDDDGNYLMAAHVLASGGGLTTTMPSGAAVVPTMRKRLSFSSLRMYRRVGSM